MWGILLGGVGAVFLLFYVYTLGGEHAVAGYKEKLAEADAKIAAQAKKITDEADNKIIDMQAAFDAGEAGKTETIKTVYVRVAADRAKYPVFQNPDCVLPEASFALLTAALKGTRTGVVLPADVLAPVPAITPAPASPTTGVQPPKPVPRAKAP